MKPAISMHTPEQLNRLSTEVFSGFSDENVTSLAESESFELSQSFTNIDLLDRLMIIHKISNESGADVAPMISMVEPYCDKTKRLPILTYGDLILINPLEDGPRTFLNGSEAEAEIHLYLKHSQIERWFSIAGLEMLPLAFTSEKEGLDDIEEIRYKASTSQAIVKARMAAREAYEKFTPEQFRRWSSYISPENLEQPPSARLYSPGTMIVKLALGLQNPVEIPDQFDALNYPDYYSEIIESTLSHGTRMLHLERTNPSLASHNSWLRRQMDDYDQIHATSIQRLLDT